MANNPLRLLLPAAVLLTGACASEELQRPLGRAGRLGAVLCPSDDGLRAVAVNPDSAARKAGLKDGDVLVGYDGGDFTKEAARRNFMEDVRGGAGKTLRVTVRRDGKTRTLKLSPSVADVYAKDELYAVLSDELLAGKPVATAVVVTQVNHTKPQFFDNAEALEAFKAGMVNTLKNNFENLLLHKPFLRCGGYGVVDRDKTDRVLRELNFQMTGAVSADTAKQVGRMTGASHLLFVDFTRYQQPSGSYEDDSSVRLIAVESGSVLASVRFRQRADAR